MAGYGQLQAIAAVVLGAVQRIVCGFQPVQIAAHLAVIIRNAGADVQPQLRGFAKNDLIESFLNAQ
ncbi:hypothetical protein D3C71_2071300 [compost metagenome]